MFHIFPLLIYIFHIGCWFVAAANEHQNIIMSYMYINRNKTEYDGNSWVILGTGGAPIASLVIAVWVL